MENARHLATQAHPETAGPDMELPPLPRRLNHGNAEAFLAQCVQGLYLAGGPGKQVVIDGKQLQDFDSSAIAVLVGLRRVAEERQLSLRFLNLPERLRGLSVLYGVGDWLPA